MVLALLAGCAGLNDRVATGGREPTSETIGSWHVREAADALRAARIEWDWRPDRNPRHRHAEEDLRRFAVAVDVLRADGLKWARGAANPGCAAAGICTGARYTLPHEGKDRAPDLLLYEDGGVLVAVVEVETAEALETPSKLGREAAGRDGDGGWTAYGAMARREGSTFFVLLPDDLPVERLAEARTRAESLGARVLMYRDPVSRK